MKHKNKQKYNKKNKTRKNNNKKTSKANGWQVRWIETWIPQIVVQDLPLVPASNSKTG